MIMNIFFICSGVFLVCVSCIMVAQLVRLFGAIGFALGVMAIAGIFAPGVGMALIGAAMIPDNHPDWFYVVPATTIVLNAITDLLGARARDPSPVEIAGSHACYACCFVSLLLLI